MNPTPPPPLPPPPVGAPFLPSHPPNPPPLPSLTTALSELTSLLDLTDATLRSLPTPIATTTAAFVPCPFNPNHCVPPSSLFSHYLNCPTPLSLHYTFHYPLTLRSTSSTRPTPTLPSDSSDLTISLDDYIANNSNDSSFFYQNCPGPVTLTPSVQRPPSLSLPRVLYIECADFVIDSSLKGVVHFITDFIQFLPSEIWAVRSETEAWGGGFPAFYSSRILRAVLRLKDCKLFHLYEWIISNSPRYGVIIDLAMRDHVAVLVKLCLKAIVREAFELVRVKCGDGELEKENVLLGLSNQSFECPVLVKVMTWLAFQFSLVYGEVNGKFFAVDVLKECISDSASRASFFPLDGKDAELSDKEEPMQSIESINDTTRDDRENLKSVTVGNSEIYISEVAAAVAALQERFLIEEKIKALLYSQPLSAYQRNMEHAHFSKLVEEERQRREDYRPIIENDGFFRQRSNNQEANKVKTREELLAEERDYKRRRMSYRGKKHKRNPVEVMRGIIEEYMEEARQAGGIGGTSEAGEVTEALVSENLDRQASATYVSGPRRISETPEVNSSHSADYRKDLYSHHYSEDFKDDSQQSRQDSTLDRRANANYISESRINSETHEENRRQSVDYRRDLHSRHHSEDLKEDRQRTRQDSTSDHGRQFPIRNVDNVRYDRDDYSGSRDGYSRRSHERTNEALNGKSYKRSRDEHERHTHRRRDEPERTSHKRERDDNNWEDGSRGRKKRDSFSKERDEDQGGHVDRKRSKMNRNSSSRHELHEFEDRYNPAVSHDQG